jgi:adenosylmethionine-8-amino-7-oxononanoate aminotransferase
MAKGLLWGFAAGLTTAVVVEVVRRAMKRAAASRMPDTALFQKNIKRISCRPNHGPLGCTGAPSTHTKRGVEHTWNGGEKRMLCIGNACSEIFGGKQLVECLKAGNEYEAAALAKIAGGEPAPPLVQHTSSSLPPQLADFVDALSSQLPPYIRDGDDWAVSLQITGADSVHAGVEMLLQLQAARGKAERIQVAVANRSYHGPPSTSLGNPAKPLAPALSTAKPAQLIYEAPTPFMPADGVAALRASWKEFFATHGKTLGVVCVEPQWGSSCAAAIWPKELLAEFIGLAQKAGALVVCDEVMCGLGRHGLGTCFLAEAWGLTPDVITFGKAVACGMFPLAGAILAAGAKDLGKDGRSVAQSHTYAAASPRALMAATAVLLAIPTFQETVAKSGAVLGSELAAVEKIAKGKLNSHGHGLMRGMLLDKSVTGDARAKAAAAIKKACLAAGVAPYFVPVGGVMITPPYDVNVDHLVEAGARLREAIGNVAIELGW